MSHFRKIKFSGRQGATFKIFVISQDHKENWNKGRLFNIGYQMAMKGSVIV